VLAIVLAVFLLLRSILIVSLLLRRQSQHHPRLFMGEYRFSVWIIPQHTRVFSTSLNIRD